VCLEKPIPYLLELFSFCSFFPICSSIDTQEPKWAQEPGPLFVSNGPFMLKEWKHYHELIAVRNPEYWNTQMPRPDRIHFSMIGDEMTALQLFEQGSLDMIGEPFCPLPLEALSSLKAKGALKTHPIGATTFITFNLERFPFNNKHIRQAFSHAINRKALIQNILNSTELPALSMIPPVLTQNTHETVLEDNDPTAARQLLQQGLDELGISKEDLPHLTYSYFQSDRHHQIAQALQQQWKEVLGVEVQLETMEFKILMDRLCKRDYQFGQNMWAAQYHDPMNIFERFYSKSQPKNYPGWENPLYQKLLDKSFYASVQERAELLATAESLFLEEMPLSPIYHWNMIYITQPKLPEEVISQVFNLQAR
jgi:oligopeptide transport system substrate-binding protein